MIDRRQVPRAWVPEENENRLAEFRTKAGLTIPALGRMIGVSYGTIRGLELCQTSPTRYGDGKVKPWVLAACKALGKGLEDVFPHEFCTFRPLEMTTDQLEGVVFRRDEADIEDILDAREAIRILAGYNKRLARVMVLRSHDMTFADIAEIMGLSTERIRQMECKGMRYLRKELLGREAKVRKKKSRV